MKHVVYPPSQILLWFPVPSTHLRDKPLQTVHISHFLRCTGQQHLHCRQKKTWQMDQGGQLSPRGAPRTLLGKKPIPCMMWLQHWAAPSAADWYIQRVWKSCIEDLLFLLRSDCTTLTVTDEKTMTLKRTIKQLIHWPNDWLIISSLLMFFILISSAVYTKHQ